ncbi:flavin reductase family protein [Trinickia caryophylli]|uniref:NADH-FMN oxidoreductase RutF, flavin reductase (DIM6/NTAB) family n=1 Tax=Trinickia caryophylli TaxID=28094 RepID=A0A1X7G5I4_TRICW|nr:flavin reductase family protein [Trinickia caryophylli]WQE14127.1 flavin reductase family protein [Trinickia caryophylli]GLU33374.1 hypothetical protein Busp01_32160 [Trinickia caryophylli]SMF64158.1 NADH-FMN oxidoreductase RutF, flavin reductase (DIM6/NTAB) family [Trinickia caryophylli]
MSDRITKPTFDERTFRDVVGTFATGVTVVTTCDAMGAKHGLTANSFSSVSLDPPLILWCQATASKSYAAFRENSRFAINILAHDQMWMSRHFAKPSDDKFRDIDYALGSGGAPLLRGTAASLECVKVAEYPCGDHVVHIGRVTQALRSGRASLAFCAGHYLSVPSCHGDLPARDTDNTLPASLIPVTAA